MKIRCGLALGGLLALLAAAPACTLEPRGDPEVEEPAEPLAVEPDPVEPEEAVLVTLEVFREAVRVGDLSLALSLLHGEAVLHDALAEEVGSEVTRGEMLMELRRRHAEGMSLELLGESVRALDGPFLVTSTWLLRDGADDPEESQVRLVESAVLTPSSEGWRIVLFHRSRLPTL